MGLFSRTKNVDIFFVGCDGTDIDRGIYSFYIDIDNGTLYKKKFVKSLANPISMSLNGRFMNITYRNSTGQKTDGGIWQYACMELQLGLAARASLDGKTYVGTAVDGNNKYAYAIDYYNGQLVRSPIKGSKLTKLYLEDQLHGKSVDPIKQSESHPTSILYTPDHYLIVTDLGGDEVIVYKQDENGHLIRDEERSFKVSEGSGPRKLIFAHNGEYAYMINEISSMIHVYHYHDGHFELVQEVSSYLKEEFDGVNIPTDLLISDDDSYLFVTNKGDNTVVVYEINEENGTISRVDCIEVDDGPNCMALFENQYLVICSKSAGTIESFEIRTNERNGILFETHSAISIHSPVCMESGKTHLRVTD